ncbi:ComEA family DNA-binding protein [uncultured Microbacterium sp.]|uniref:ComEA family DNA-binding protein n=1 Tax=uncultured Microbacterium sp. TaxID=191216 RepID=UPI0025CC4AF0|nr:ComEA family DNA-binding protein [uncultured Microbacterium sp.]
MTTPPDDDAPGEALDDALEAYPRAPARVRLGVAAAIVLVITGLVVAVVWGMLRPGAAPYESVTASPVAASDVLYVHVGGAVRAPGLYELPAGARVVDAVAAALGFTDDAAREGINLARPLTDGEQLLVPSTTAATGEGGAPGVAGGSGAAAGSASGLLNLNTATQAQLEELPRIGPALAKRIVEWREQHGRFTSVDDLGGVSGIGEKMLETLRPLVTV